MLNKELLKKIEGWKSGKITIRGLKRLGDQIKKEMRIKEEGFLRVKYHRLMRKATLIKNRIMWGDKNKSISIIGVKANEENIDTVLNLGKKTRIVRMNYDGQIIKFGILENEYTSQPLTNKEILGLNDAIKLYKEAMNLFPNKGSPHMCIGRIYKFLGLYNEAIECYKIAIKLQPKLYEDLQSRIHECEEKRKGQYLIIEKIGTNLN